MFYVYGNYNIVEAFGGMFWTLAYIFIILKSRRDRAIGMPVFSLFFNVVWEALALTFFRHPFVTPSAYLWLVFDLVICWQTWIYGRGGLTPVWQGILGRGKVWVGVVIGLGGLTYAFALLFAFGKQLGSTYSESLPDKEFLIYSGFLMNLIMSYLFIVMLDRRGDLRGQSLSIAICKLLGTLLTAIDVLFFQEFSGKALIGVLAIGCLGLDVCYVMMIRRCERATP